MRKILRLFILCLLLPVLAACGKEKKSRDSEYFIPYINAEETRVEQIAYRPEGKVPTVKEVMDKLQEVSRQENVRLLLPAEVKIQDYELTQGILQLDMNTAYSEQEKTREILVRSGLVRAFLQVPEVRAVEIYIDQQPLRDAKGESVGPMDETCFVENTGKEINAYQSAELTLYFTDEDGEKLIKEKRNLYYSSNVPLERIVVEELIKGPKTEGHYATLPEGVKVLGATISEGICYLNFDQEFIDSTLPVKEEIPIYSLANSLAATCEAKSIQIAVNGENKMVFRENMRLDQFYQAEEELTEE